MKLTSRKKVEIIRPEVQIECNSYLMCVYVIARIYLKFFRRIRVILTIGETPVGIRKYWVIPKINVKWR